VRGSYFSGSRGILIETAQRVTESASSSTWQATSAERTHVLVESSGKFISLVVVADAVTRSSVCSGIGFSFNFGAHSLRAGAQQERERRSRAALNGLFNVAVKCNHFQEPTFHLARAFCAAFGALEI
jgi:hypothetical protein